MLAARDRTRTVKSGRTQPERLVAYASEDAHSSVSKAAGIAGVGRQNLRSIPCDEYRRMRTDELRSRIIDDRENGRRPFFVCATAGTTSTMAIDPIPEIGAVCSEFGLWLHVDAAMAGSAAICPEFRYVHDGIEMADSYCFNPHKWLLTNFDCDCFYIKNRADLLRSLSILPDYLRDVASDSGTVIDYRDWQIPLGRRFRALKLWFTLRSYGATTLRSHIRRHVAMAYELAEWIGSEPEFELVVPPELNLVCFRHRGGDEINRRVLDLVNRSGRLYMSHTRIGGSLALRLCIGQAATTLEHVRASWEHLRETFRSQL
jgi:aromatic-L-amino-acid decarboxylase